MYDPNVSDHAPDISSVYRTSLHSSGALELVLCARQSADAPHIVDLVVGRRVAKRRESVDKKAERAPRPDDPLPRAPRQLRWDSSDDERPTVLDARVRKRGHLTLTPERSRGGHTPGRRGEKRPQRKAPVDEPAYVPIAAALPPSGAPAADDPGMEEANRQSIKRLVRNQLVGSGMERGERAFDACFQAAYAGTCLVFVRRSTNPAPNHPDAPRRSQGRCAHCRRAPGHVHQPRGAGALCATP